MRGWQRLGATAVEEGWQRLCGNDEGCERWLCVAKEGQRRPMGGGSRRVGVWGRCCSRGDGDMVANGSNREEEGGKRSEDALVVGDAAADGELVDVTGSATGGRCRGRPSVRRHLQRIVVGPRDGTNEKPSSRVRRLRKDAGPISKQGITTDPLLP
ncbi:hypothetical protein BHE74_00029235 [Ensete ventricosum]|nr:hypothetical protein BHE74_00029235 [Ensete ventricosum]